MTTFNPPTQLFSTRPCPQCLLRCHGRLALLPLGSAFIRAKRHESLLSHTTLPVPEAQRRSLTVAPGSSEGLFNEDILAEVVAQVQHSSLISSNLAVSRSLSRGRSWPSSSSPLVDPHSSGPPRGRPYGKLSSSSSRSGGRKRFRGGKGSLFLPNLRVSGSRSRLLP